MKELRVGALFLCAVGSSIDFLATKAPQSMPIQKKLNSAFVGLCIGSKRRWPYQPWIVTGAHRIVHLNTAILILYIL